MRRAAEDIFFDYRKEWQEKIREREKMLKSNEMVENNII
jgi:hypothetical protein